jgi:predicted nucleotidyltransferase
MQPTLHIEQVFGSRGRVAVLRCLAGVSVPMSIRQVAAQAGLSHVSAADALDTLVEMGLVACSTTGRSRIHWLERRNLYVDRVVLPAMAAESGLPEALLGELRAIVPDDAISAILYGSYARGDQRSDSDVDLLVVMADDAGVARALARVDADSARLAACLGAHVNALGYALAEAAGLLSTGDNFMDGVVRDGVVLRGLHPHDWRPGAPRA